MEKSKWRIRKGRLSKLRMSKFMKSFLKKSIDGGREIGDKSYAVEE